MIRSMSWLFAAVMFVATTQSVFAQGIFNLGGNDAFGEAATEVEASVNPKTAKRGDTVIITVKVTLPEGSHTYPVNKAVAAGGETTITITGLGLTAIDKTFTPDRKPLRKVDPLLKETIEIFKDKITWTRNYKVDGDAPDEVQLKGRLDGQVCDDENCKLLNKDFTIKLAVTGPVLANSVPPETEKTSRATGPAIYQVKHPDLPPLAPLDAKQPTRWTFKLSPQDAKPGDKVTATLNAVLADGYHTFAVDHLKENIGIPTTATITNLTGLESIDGNDKFTTKDRVDLHDADGKVQRIHHNEVTWTREFTVAASAAQTGYGMAGKVRFQVCTATSCTPGAFSFSLGDVDPAQDIKSASDSQTGTNSTANSNASLSGKAADVFKDLKIRSAASESDDSLGMYLLYAFLGGLILNVMPCVLPVIAIKALSFAQQAGEDRKRIFQLNMTYSAGVVVVFLVLATLAVVSGLGWGALFQEAGFTIIMSAIVFAMGLSLLGVFDIPIPGLVGSAAGQHREGLPGAFLTGVFATVLATPCSGPFLGTALAWSVKQNPIVIYSVWAMMGVGMASPYMLFAFFPGFVKFLPKPGNWMIRFKEFAGLVLMGTTIFLLSSLTEVYMIPTLIGLFGVGTSVWMLGNLSNLMSSNTRRWTVRFSAMAVCLLAAWLGTSMYKSKTSPDAATMIAWEKFDIERIASALAEGKTVMIDFTANWCLTCHALEASTLNTKATVDKLSENDIVAMKADWTDGNETIGNALRALDRNAIPTLAIFSPSRPKEPIVLYDLWTQSNLLNQLDIATSEAVPPGTNQALQSRE